MTRKSVYKYNEIRRGSLNSNLGADFLLPISQEREGT